ncbi:MAG TPA: hypothetical protein VF446_20495 [Trinickia sp.]
MGVTADGTYVSGAPDTLVGNEAPTDSGATWMYAGTTADGKPVLTQGTVPVDPLLQQYISMYGGSASPGQVPTGYKYDAPGGNGSGLNLPQVTGPFTQFNSDDLTFVRNTTSDVASMVSTNAGRFGAATAAGAAIPSPLSPALATVAYGSTIVGVGADVVSQFVQPNSGQCLFNGFTSIAANSASEKYPFLSPAINEAANDINNGSFANWVQGHINNILGVKPDGGGK